MFPYIGELAKIKIIGMKKIDPLSNKFFIFGIIFFGFVAISVWGNYGTNSLADAESQKFEHIAPKDAYTFIQDHQNDENFVILDVRTPQEIAKGYIEGAITHDFFSETFPDELNKLDKQKTYLIYCRSGRRSSKALQLMQQLNFRTVYNMTSGILGWHAESLPIVTSQSALEQKHTPDHTSKYKGQEHRAIKSLSEEDIQELRSGGGWGLAKAAELNGVPGPVHLLQMKAEIPLTPEQIKKIEELYASMNQKAVRVGTQLIELEGTLNAHFAERTITEEILQNLLEKIGQTRTQLRYVHLATHLKTPAILTSEQIARYNALRGYASDDLCANIPEGHDPEMWKKHNNCP